VTNFEPRILGILCTWCSYSGADGAGQSRTAYPPNVEVVRVMCSGRVDPSFIISALADGMDGVLVCGCHPGDCHYINGNCKAAARMEVLGTLLESLGIERERVRLEWVSASEGARYAALVAEMTEQVRALGPLEWAAHKHVGAGGRAVRR
jgi:F420-non-reducing hydrogenase iron-sulfur subunit